MAQQSHRLASVANERSWLLPSQVSRGRLVAVRLLAQIVSDAGLVWLASWIAYLLRYQLKIGGPIRDADWEPFSTFSSKVLLFMVLTLLVFVVRGVYRMPRTAGFLDEAMQVTGGLTTAMAGVILWAFLLRFSPSRLVFIYAWALAILLLVGQRLLARSARQWMWSLGIGVDRVLIVGAGQSGRRIMQAFSSQPRLGYRIVGFVDRPEVGETVGVATEHGVLRANRLGSTEDLADIVGREHIDEVIIALPAEEQRRVPWIVDQCRARAVTFKVVPDLVQLSLDRVDLGEVAGIPLIGVKSAAIEGGSYLIKRTIDVTLAGFVLLVTAVPMAIIALLIRRDSPGPILYRQVRVGRNGVPFTCIKFRCMVEDADQQRAALMAANDCTDPRLFKLRDDPRLTRTGRWLRRWSLDELPQFVHVVRGQMSVVGPRPPLPEEVEQYEDWHWQRLLVTPGLTGLWQINGRSNLTFDEMVRLDLYYAEHWSPWLEAKIILRTVPAVVSGRGAY